MGYARWLQLTSAARALWGWPRPGAPFDPQASFLSELADGTPIPGCFALLRLAISQVELLSPERSWFAPVPFRSSSALGLSFHRHPQVSAGADRINIGGHAQGLAQQIELTHRLEID